MKERETWMRKKERNRHNLRRRKERNICQEEGKREHMLERMNERET